jgi:hypothetical protein
MTVYRKHVSYAADGEPEPHYDQIPAEVSEVRETGDGWPWFRSGVKWATVLPSGETVYLDEVELLEEFGPVTDDKEQVKL